MCQHLRPYLAAVVPLALCLSLPARAESAVSCPEDIAVTERAEAPIGMLTAPVTRRHALIGANVVNDRPTALRPETPADLVPDGEEVRGKTLVQTWELTEHRADPIYVRCAYADTAVTLVVVPAKDATTCEQRLGWDAKRRMVAW